MSFLSLLDVPRNAAVVSRSHLLESVVERLADVLGQPVYANPEPEASIRGAAVFVLEKLGVRVPDLKAGAPIKPRKPYASRYAADRVRHHTLETLLEKHSRAVTAPAV